jgi:hypothetical protein
MRIYIDEAGSFITSPSTKGQSFSLVLALAVPTSCDAELMYNFLRLRDAWPNPAVEIKGSTLNESQAAQVIDMLCRYDVLVNFFAIDMATHGEDVVDDLKLRQAAAVTAHLTPEHHPDMVTQLRGIEKYIEKMPNQLFLQAFLSIQLFLEVIQEVTLYFVQRNPKELGEMAWIIDRKDRTITRMEDTWTTLLLPISESQRAKNPLTFLRGADYSYFNARYGFTEDNIDGDMVRHLAWMERTYGIAQCGGRIEGVNSKLLYSDQRDFLDSRQSLGLQLADMLATILRRALNGHLQFSGWKDFGKLLVRKGRAQSAYLQLGSSGSEPQYLDGHAKKVAQALNAKAKSMLLDRDTGTAE